MTSLTSGENLGKLGELMLWNLKSRYCRYLCHPLQKVPLHWEYSAKLQLFALFRGLFVTSYVSKLTWACSVGVNRFGMSTFSSPALHHCKQYRENRWGCTSNPPLRPGGNKNTMKVNVSETWSIPSHLIPWNALIQNVRDASSSRKTEYNLGQFSRRYL